MIPVKKSGRAHPFKRVISMGVSLIPLMTLTLGSCGKKEEPVTKEVIRPVKTLSAIFARSTSLSEHRDYSEWQAQWVKAVIS